MFATLYPETEIAETDVLPPSLSARRLAGDVVFPSSAVAFIGWLCHGRPSLPDLLGAPGLRGARGQPHLCRGRRQHPGRVQAALPGRQKLQPDFAFWTRQLASTQLLYDVHQLLRLTRLPGLLE